MPSTPYPTGIKRMDDYLGRYVRLRDDVRSVGGAEFKAGTLLFVHSHHRGRLCVIDSAGRCIRQLDRWAITLEPEE